MKSKEIWEGVEYLILVDFNNIDIEVIYIIFEIIELLV